MSFGSTTFLAFLLAVVVVYYAMPVRARWAALLVMRQVEFPKTRDIERLLELVAVGDGPLAEALADVAELTPYGVEYRYPGEYEPVPAEAAITCVSLARRVHDEIARRLPEDIRQ